MLPSRGFTSLFTLAAATAVLLALLVVPVSAASPARAALRVQLQPFEKGNTARAVLHTTKAGRATAVLQRRNGRAWKTLARVHRRVRAGRTSLTISRTHPALRLRCGQVVRLLVTVRSRGTFRASRRTWATKQTCPPAPPQGADAPDTAEAAVTPSRNTSTTTINAPAGAPEMGITEDVQYLRGAALTARLDRYVALGARWVRFQVLWDVVERAGPGLADWSTYDVVLREMTARGLKPLPIILTTPPWAREPGCDHVLCAPRKASDYARFAAEVARRYAGIATFFEIWNEPNNFHFWKPGPDPVAYALLLKQASRAIKRVAPEATVLSGGLAPAGTERSTTGGFNWVNPVEFLTALYAAGAGSSFDAVAVHPYTFPDLPLLSPSTSAWHEVYATKPSIRSVMEANGDGSKRVWATEFGAPTASPDDRRAVDEATQAAILLQGYEHWATQPWAGPMIVWTFADWDAAYEDAHFGLVRADGTPKPAYDVFADLARRAPSSVRG